MSQGERTGYRDLTYNIWHREKNLRQYLGNRSAWELGMIDLDDVEYCRYCCEAVALIETQRSTAAPKSATVTAGLARRLGIPAFSVSVVAEGPNFCTDCGAPVIGSWSQVEKFRVRQIEPNNQDEMGPMPPDVFAKWLHSLRDTCTCPGAVKSRQGR